MSRDLTARCSYQRLANSAALEALFFPYVFQFTLYIAVLLFAILPDDSSHECVLRDSYLQAVYIMLRVRSVTVT